MATERVNDLKIGTATFLEPASFTCQSNQNTLGGFCTGKIQAGVPKNISNHQQ